MAGLFWRTGFCASLGRWVKGSAHVLLWQPFGCQIPPLLRYTLHPPPQAPLPVHGRQTCARQWRWLSDALGLVCSEVKKEFVGRRPAKDDMSGTQAPARRDRVTRGPLLQTVGRPCAVHVPAMCRPCRSR